MSKKIISKTSLLLSILLLLSFSACGAPTPTETPTEPPVFNLSAEWTDYLDEKLASVPEGKSFIFLTDTHSSSNLDETTEIMRYLAYKLGDNVKVVYGGDSFNNEDTHESALTQLKACFSETLYAAFGDNALFTRGNHDSNDMVDGAYLLETEVFDNTVGKIKNAVVDEEEAKAFGKFVYDYCESRPSLGIDPTTAKEQAEAFMKMHYYVDDADAKIRYIVLDSAGMTWLQHKLFGDKHTFNGALLLQLNWLAKTLESTPKDFDVVVSVHSIGNDHTEQHNLYDGYSKHVYELLSMFKYGQKGSTSKIAITTSSPLIKEYFNKPDNAYSIEVDFSDRDDCSVITVSGHWHDNGGYYVGKTISGTWGTDIATCDENSRPSSRDDAILSIRTPDAKPYNSTVTGVNAHCFDIITIAEDEIVCTRVGRGEDRFFLYN